MTSQIQIEIHELKNLIGTPDCPLLFDVCVDDDFGDDPRLIPGAVRQDHKRLNEIMDRCQNNDVIFICQKGLKLSLGAAAIFRANGIAARALKGGNYAWRDADFPLTPADRMPKKDPDGKRILIAPESITPDIAACNWLVRRFVDRNACMITVPPDQLVMIAEKFDATPVSLPTAGSASSSEKYFDAMVEDLCLQSAELEVVSQSIVSGKTNLSAGFLNLFSGLVLSAGNDTRALDVSLHLFDWLYQSALSASCHSPSVKEIRSIS